MPKPPWTSVRGVGSVVEAWLASGSVSRCLAAERLIGSQSPSFGPMPAELARPLREALARRGVTRLYRHQIEAVTSTLAGRHVVIATPTASGKSLCFHLPVLNA